jgi:hypothetical protein
VALAGSDRVGTALVCQLRGKPVLDIRVQQLAAGFGWVVVFLGSRDVLGGIALADTIQRATYSDIGKSDRLNYHCLGLLLGRYIRTSQKQDSQTVTGV